MVPNTSPPDPELGRHLNHLSLCSVKSTSDGSDSPVASMTQMHRPRELYQWAGNVVQSTAGSVDSGLTARDEQQFTNVLQHEVRMMIVVWSLFPHKYDHYTFVVRLCLKWGKLVSNSRG